MHNRVGVGVRQRPEKHAVNNAERRRRHADTDGENDYHRGGEAGIPPQAADGVAHVPAQVVEPAPDAAGAIADQHVQRPCSSPNWSSSNGGRAMCAAFTWLFSSSLGLRRSPGSPPTDDRRY